MGNHCFRSLLVAVFSLSILFISNVSRAQENVKKPGQPNAVQEVQKKKAEKLKPAKIILEHIGDAHDFHFATINGAKISIPLPVILYSSGKGLSIFMASAFHHGQEVHDGYRLLEDEFFKGHGLENVKDKKGHPLFKIGKIYSVDAEGMPLLNAKVYDFSLTKNVVQMLISVILLAWIMISIAKKYGRGKGVHDAPSGFQNAVEPVITFVRDEVAKPNFGTAYEKYMPYLLSLFFFILINNLIGLVPGTANVTGNIAFTGILGILSFIILLGKSTKHYWGHIFNPPVPGGIKPIMVPVEILSLFTKPFALIIRLFANMVSGHIIILSFICLIFIFGAMNKALGWGTSPFFVLLSVFIYLIEILVAFIQAFIFTNLTAVFVGEAMVGGHGKEEEHHDAALV
ncbi:MAG: F0F1 ATP synthase subunit A [Chitinophagales bacterium]